ncbi:MAG TPA: hypothetical protein VGL09_08200 [Methylomirabilota bacterium]|jgi:hypothetical protein
MKLSPEGHELLPASLSSDPWQRANRYRVYHKERGIPWRLVNDQLCRQMPDGTPDYTDPAVFPVLWSEDN